MEELAAKIGKRLKASRAVLVTAESCTGGWVAQAVTAVAGSSDWFERGFVTYSNDAKRELLGVRADTLARHGAVSEETAREMASGALRQSKGSLSVAVTGIAGPGGGSPAKPVGTVCFAWERKKGARRTETRLFVGDRESVRKQSVIHALEGVLKLLDETGARS
ncbi:MAG TPA: nicotinamide-nucleotide amidohydrolase family protein [Burkholderiales bacterium]|nr:nicotinamide-nucleotide amidohydrolase family protein [Burkholderiales bacterium]